ncbi:hypothetical protein BJF83_08265 [Nocardiopsis sp. CNR-923]|uniref:hypothetical protein n=1 Tax=Nocardiopsis sp. CNR-923 TaxID=1904965 RepID=UPI00095D761C|nr:hypothetical protein [Nocardiopsis sp. CNR-923]OLT30309.1 hypothetical protein BJF83_08265 [Nocardiopsis sp. CNR-923]
MDSTERAAALAERTLVSTRERLAELDALPTAEHVGILDDLQQELSAVLGALDQGADTPDDPRYPR